MTHPKLAVARSGWGGRGYRIPNRADWDTGKPIVYPSVTTVLKAVAKPGITQWAVDQTAAFAVENLQYLYNVSEERGWRYLRWYWSRSPELVGKELRLHHEGVRDDAADLGTNIHEWIEAEIDGTLMPPSLDTWEAEQMADVFWEWMEGHTVISHHQEFTLVNDDDGYAGTGDADWSIRCDHDGPSCLGQKPGEFIRTLVDLKSSRHTWPEHGMQLAALYNAPRMMVEVDADAPGAMLAEKVEQGQKVKSWWNEEATPKFEAAALLHLRPADLDAKGNDIPAFCKLIDKTSDLDMFWIGFKGAYALTKMNRELDLRAKGRGEPTITELTEVAA